MGKLVVMAGVVLGVGLTGGEASAQGVWTGYYPGYWYATPWDVTASIAAQSGPSQSLSGQLTRQYEATVDQRANAARQADIQQRDRNAAALLQANTERWKALQAEEFQERVAAAQRQSLANQRQAIVQGVTGAWKQFLVAGGGRSLPTDLGGTTHVALGPTNGSASATRAIVPAVQAAHGADVRTRFRQPSLFTNDWFQRHADAWKPAKWVPAGGAANAGDNAWHYVSWGGLSNWLGWNSKPISYDYGINITIHDGMVFRLETSLEEKPLATEAGYYQQAVALAQTNSGDAKAAEEWLPLGVFALVPEGQNEPAAVTHLAVSKSGLIGGNYYNPKTKVAAPLRGAVDRQTQRVAVMPAGQQEKVFEAGLYNLTLDTTPVLVFFDPGKTQQWLLVRLKPPEEPRPAARADAAPPADRQDRATVEIRVPADAAVWVDGYRTRQTGAVRTLSTPPLQPGETYAYDVRARWTENGAPVEQTQTVVVKPGERSRVTFPAAGP